MIWKMLENLTDGTSRGILDSWETAERTVAVLLCCKTKPRSYYTSVFYITWEENKQKNVACWYFRVIKVGIYQAALSLFLWKQGRDVQLEQRQWAYLCSTSCRISIPVSENSQRMSVMSDEFCFYSRKGFFSFGGGGSKGWGAGG